MNDLFLILFLAGGIFLIALEITVVPGFTYFGVSGTILLIIAIIFSFLNYSVNTAFGIMFGSIIIVIVFFIWFFKKGINRGFSLNEIERSKDGFRPFQRDYQQYIDQIGKAHSPLRPAGIVIIDGEKLSAVTQGDYIEAGEDIQVLKVEGNKLVVIKKT